MSRARAIGNLTGLNLVGASVGLGILVITANLFGTTREVEVFFAASTLQRVLLRFVQGGQVAEAFLPVYHRLKSQGGSDFARRAFAVIVNRMMVGALVILGLVWLAAPWLLQVIVPGFGEGDRKLGVEMFRVIALVMPLQVLGALQLGLSNAEKWFGRPEAMGVFSQMLSLILIPLLAPLLGVWALVVALVTSQTCCNVGYVWVLRTLGYRHRWCWETAGFHPGTVLRNLVATSGQMVSAQVFSVAMNAGLSLLPQGSYAVFRYVRQIQTKTSSLLLRPVSTVFFTHFAESFQRGSAEVCVLARSALAKTLLLGLGAIAVLQACAQPLLQGLWGGAEFPPEQVGMAAGLLVWVIGLVIPQAVNAVLRKLLVAAGLMGFLYTGLAITLLVGAVLVWWLAPRWGLSGVVFVLACTQLGQMFLAWELLRRHRPELLFRPDWPHIGRVLATAIGAGAVAWLVGWSVDGVQVERSRLGHLILAGLLAGLAVALMLVLGKMLGLSEVNRAWAVFERRWAAWRAASQ